MHLVVDAANVVGSRPDGWWRDRPGAAARLVNGLVAALRAGALDGPVTVVLEGAARAGVTAGAGPLPGLAVRHAERDGDSVIAALAADLAAGGTEVVVVTADHGLRDRVRAAGARVVGPTWLRDRI